MDGLCDNIRDLFRAYNLRCTKQRACIYEALAASKSHPTAEQLFTGVRSTTIGEGLSLATVYNTLDTFATCGLVRRIPAQTASGPSRYDADLQPHVHVTLDDGTIIDVPEDLGDDLLSKLDRPTIAKLEQALGVRVDHLGLELRASRPGNTTASHASARDGTASASA